MKVLFIAPKFFGYEKLIKEELERLGCVVDFHNDRPASAALMKGLIRFMPEIVSYISNNYFDRIIDDSRCNNYDVVFVIKGEALSYERLKRLRLCQPRAQFLYYTWDSLKNFKGNQAKLELFDKAYSFDRFDSLANSKVSHLSLFYVRAYEELNKLSVKNIVQDIDLLFLGSIHSDRYSVVKRITNSAKQTLPNIRIYRFFFYQSKWVFALRKLLDFQFMPVPWRSIKWQSLNLKKTLGFISRSRILIDVHHPGQSGLTMRTIESLGAQKKLITTNPDVINYDFYRPENICVVDRVSPVIPSSFFRTPYQILPSEIYCKYSLNFWLGEIFGHNFFSKVTSDLSDKNKTSLKSPIKVLVTGANSFIGNVLCDALIRDGHNVSGALRQSYDTYLQNSNVKYFLVGDINEGTDWSETLNGTEVVIHLAARVHVMQESTTDQMAKYLEVNLYGSTNLARQAARAGIKRFVYVSSIKVNGENTENKPFTEKDAPKPQDPYAISKWQAEQALHKISEETGMELVIVRPPLVYGPGVRANFMTFLKVVDKWIPSPFRAIRNQRSLIYVENIADALILCATHPRAAGQTYLVSDGGSISSADLFKKIAKALNRGSLTFYLPIGLMRFLAKSINKLDQFDRLTQSLVINNSKICKELNWRPLFTLDEGLRRTAKWYKGK